jgi:tRNA pseudouridine38-40 synthase
MPPVAPRRVALRLAYLGAGFSGWQRQADARTVQGELEAGLARVFRMPVRVVGAGRTDAGVHATGQVAHLEPPFRIPPAGLVRALNSVLPDDLRVLAAREVPETFHARASATGKRYVYRFAWGHVLDPWQALRCCELGARPDLEAMASALAAVRGTHDFAAFALSGHSGHGARGTRRTIARATLQRTRRGADLVLEGDGFLRGMVRRIAGALVEVGRGALDVRSFTELLSGATAGRPAPTAPAHGLTLERVFYPPLRTPPAVAPPSAPDS